MAMSGTDSLEVTTIYKAYFLRLNFREYPQQKYGTNVAPFYDPEIPIDPSYHPFIDGIFHKPSSDYGGTTISGHLHIMD